MAVQIVDLDAVDRTSNRLRSNTDGGGSGMAVQIFISMLWTGQGNRLRSNTAGGMGGCSDY